MDRKLMRFFFITFTASLLLFAVPASWASTTIDAEVVRNQVGSGSTFISSGFPLPPGLVTEAAIRNGDVKIKVSGAEVAANVTALRGRHSDGTLRSILIQFTVASMAQNKNLVAQVIVGETRTNTDPTYVRPTLGIITNNNTILPTNPIYITTTGITLRKLLPMGSGSASEEKLYTALAKDRFDSLAASEIDGTASYENISAMLSLWARSGERKYQKEAVKKTLAWLPYNTAAFNQSPSCVHDAITNHDSRSGGQACGVPGEWNYPRFLSYAQMYLMTGYRDFWGEVAFIAQLQQTGITSQALAYSTIYSTTYAPRFNYASKYGNLLPAVMIDATIPVTGQWHTGRVFTWNNQFQWTIDAMEYHAWATRWIPYQSGTGNVPAINTSISRGGVSATLKAVFADRNEPRTEWGSAMPATGWIQVTGVTGGSFSSGALTGIGASATGADVTDYRTGLVGVLSYTNPNEIPVFQLTFPAHFLMDYYLYVQRDSRIPVMVKANLDVILNNTRPLVNGVDYYYNKGNATWGYASYGHPYLLEIPVSVAEAEPYSLPEYARMLAFVIKTVGDTTVNGSLYSVWYERFIDTANVNPVAVLTWAWKNFGQFYGWGQDTSWMMAQGTLVNYGPSTMRTPTYYATIPGDVPDIAREGVNSRYPSVPAIFGITPGP